MSSNPELEEGDVTSTGMGQSGEDVCLSPAARRLIPLSIECKSLARFVGYTYYSQATSNSGASEPVVVVKANAKRPLVVVDAEYFFNLVRKTYEYR